MCSGVADFLRQEGFDVSEAYDGESALVIANEQGASISAVLTDVNMAGMDGIELWKRMKPLVSHQCKVVFMSGLAHKYLQEGSLTAGEILQKPFSFNVLIEKLLK